MGYVVSLERLSVINYSSSTSLSILNACAAVLGCFLLTPLAIFCWLCCSAVVLQLCTNNSTHLYMNAARFSLPCCLQCIRAKLA